MADQLKQLHRKLWNEAQKEEPYRELESDQVTEVIKEERGRDRRTVKKWWIELREYSIIEQVPRLDKYKVDEPEEADVQVEGNYCNINIRVDEGLRDAAESLGINISALVNDALASEVSSRRDYVSQILGQEISEEEASFILELVEKELYRKETRPEMEAKLDDQRRHIYKEVFGVEEITEEEYEHLDDLRIEAWDVAEALGLVSMS